MHSSYFYPSKKSKQSNFKTTKITKTLSPYTLEQKITRWNFPSEEKPGKKKKKTAKQWVASAVQLMAAAQLKSLQSRGISHIARVFYNL